MKQLIEELAYSLFGLEESKKFWIKDAVKHPGSLHRSLKVPAGKKISAKKLAAGAKRAKKTGNTSLKRKLNLAKTLKKMH